MKLSPTKWTRPPHTKPSHVGYKPPTLVGNSYLGRCYRSTRDRARVAGLNTWGLAAMNAVGCEQFDEAGLRAIMAANPSERYVVIDLRQEFHGFIDGRPISWVSVENSNWGNVGLALSDVVIKEVEKVNELILNCDGALIVPAYATFKSEPLAPPLVIADVSTARVETEAELVQRLGTGYFRLPITDHGRCSDADLDVLIFVLHRIAAQGDTTAIIHCQAGGGRTTLVMTLYDMLLNARHVKCVDIIQRQLALRPPHVRKAAKPPKNQLRLDMIVEKDLLKRVFYMWGER
ncbi:phosphatase [Cryptotrichosporon argae]